MWYTLLYRRGTVPAPIQPAPTGATLGGFMFYDLPDPVVTRLSDDAVADIRNAIVKLRLLYTDDGDAASVRLARMLVNAGHRPC